MTLLLKWVLGTFIPGGRIFAVLAAIGRGIAWFFMWLGADIADGFKQPQRFVVRLACMLLVFCVGGYWGIEWDADKVAQAKGEVAAMQSLWRKRDDDDARKAEQAKLARDVAEQAEQQRIAEEERKAADAAAAAQRLRQRPATAAKVNPGMLNLPALLWPGK